MGLGGGRKGTQNAVLGSFIIGSNKSLVDYLSWACLSCQGVAVHKVLYEIPALHHMVRLLNAYSPQIVFLEIDQPQEALPLARDIQVVQPDAVLIGFSAKVTRETLQAVASYGIGEILQAPFDLPAVVEAIARAMESGQRADDSELVAFQPARGGSGATTTALNVARSLAADWKQKVLLIEADLHSGPLSLLLERGEDAPSIADALDQCESLTESTWKQFVGNAHGVDLLLAPRKRRPLSASPWSCQRLLSFAAKRYDIVVADLPEILFEPFGPVLSRATQVYVVCNPNPLSIAMAQRRLTDLEQEGVNPAIVDLIVNRFPEGELKLREMENSLNRPLSIEMPAEVLRGGRTALHGGLAAWPSPLAKQYQFLAKTIAGEERTGAVQTKPTGLRGFARLLKQSLAVTASAKSGSH
jgi:pilus assembly protein CpaE